jgi:hypothetical protein
MTQVVQPAGQSARQPIDRVVDLPHRNVFWRWVWSSIRPVVGWVLALAGAIALFVGWWGVSGETLTARQLPYLVSAGLTGIALFIMAGVFLATDDVRRQFERISEIERKVDDLYALFAADLASLDRDDPGAPVTSRPDAGALLALPSGSSYHRPGCALVTGKADATAVDAATVARRGLRPCRVCSPTPPAG